MQVSTEKRTRFTDELQIIAWWAWVIGGILFCGMQFVAVVLMARDPHPLPPAGRVAIGILGGFAVICYVALIGYVNRDAGRRGMNRWVWTLLAIFVPNALGIVLYFLLRNALPLHCGKCQCTVQAGFSYCPLCGANLSSQCPRCQHAIHAGDVYCPYCGVSLAAPATAAAPAAETRPGGI